MPRKKPAPDASLFVLVDATRAYWWLRTGGFGKLDSFPLQPMTFRSRAMADSKAANLHSQYGFDFHPEPLSTCKGR